MQKLRMPTHPPVGAAGDNDEAESAKTLSGSTFHVLRRDILDLSLEPGTRLRFEDLRERYDAGVSPLREALSRLATEGLVIGVDQRGFGVTPMTAEDYVDLTHVRREIEVLTVTSAMAHGQDSWEAKLVGAFHHMILAASPVSNEFPTEWAKRHKAFHEALVAACDSPRLLAMRRQLFDHFMRYQRIAPRNILSKSIRDVENRHRAIMDAALSRNVKKATALVREHIQVIGVVHAALPHSRQ